VIFCQPNGRDHEPDVVSQVVIRRMRKADIDSASSHTSPGRGACRCRQSRSVWGARTRTEWR
jgi:hypothetical protein